MGYTTRVKVFKYVSGVILIVIGLLALVTPLTPGAWLMLVGFELIGVRLTLWDKIKEWIDRRRGLHTKNAPVTDTGNKNNDTII